MKLKEEVQELFDKFQGGYYKYQSPDKKVSLRISNRYDTKYVNIEAEYNGCNGYLRPLMITGHEYQFWFTDYENVAEGSFRHTTFEVIERLQMMIIGAKRYFEQNGFDEDLYKKSFERMHECSKLKAICESDVIFEKNMNRIANEELKLWWID